MSFFDTSAVGSGQTGPWVRWCAREKMDFAGNVLVPSRAFSLRDSEGEKEFKAMKSGVIIALDTLKIGWQLSTGMKGVAPRWEWWPSPSESVKRPDPIGDDTWKMGFSAVVYTKKGNKAVWEQAGAGSTKALLSLGDAFSNRPSSDHLPLVVWEGVTVEQGGKTPFAVPTLAVKEWVLKSDVAAEDRSDLAESNFKPAAPAAAPAAAAAAPAPAAQDDEDDEF